MKIIFTFFIIIIACCNTKLKAQSDFKITVNEPYWSNPSGYYVELKIGMLIKNIGMVKIRAIIKSLFISL